jgi:hypothetical protein
MIVGCCFIDWAPSGWKIKPIGMAVLPDSVEGYRQNILDDEWGRIHKFASA